MDLNCASDLTPRLNDYLRDAPLPFLNDVKKVRDGRRGDAETSLLQLLYFSQRDGGNRQSEFKKLHLG